MLVIAAAVVVVLALVVTGGVVAITHRSVTADQLTGRLVVGTPLFSQPIAAVEPDVAILFPSMGRDCFFGDIGAVPSAAALTGRRWHVSSAPGFATPADGHREELNVLRYDSAADARTVFAAIGGGVGDCGPLAVQRTGPAGRVPVEWRGVSSGTTTLVTFRYANLVVNAAFTASAGETPPAGEQVLSDALMVIS